MEMVSDKESSTTMKKTLHMLHIDEGENPVSIQLFGSDEDSLARAAEFIKKIPRPISSISTWVAR